MPHSTLQIRLHTEMSLKTVVAVNQLSIYRAVTIWYISRSTADSVGLNENFDISPKLVTDLSKHVNECGHPSAVLVLYLQCTPSTLLFL